MFGLALLLETVSGDYKRWEKFHWTPQGHRKVAGVLREVHRSWKKGELHRTWAPIPEPPSNPERHRVNQTVAP